MHHPLSVSLYEVGEGLICTIHSVSPSSLGGDLGGDKEEGLICFNHSVSPSNFGGD